MKNAFSVFGLALLLLAPRAQAHYHCNIGALQEVPGTPLYFANGDFYVADSGYTTNSDSQNNFVLTMDWDIYPAASSSPLVNASQTYTNYYVTTDENGITFTALDSNPGVSTDPICPGVQVCLRFVSATGPPEGSFGVWDVADYFVVLPNINYFDYNGDGNDSDGLTFSLPVGTTNGTNFIQISENDGAAGDDAFGHIHGRQFSATRPGLYCVTVQAFDNANNGPNGGPTQTPSELLPIYFQAGNQISALTMGTNQVVISFPAQLGTDYYLQSTTNLMSTNSWQTISGPISGNDSFRLIFDKNWNAAQNFYRLYLTLTP